MVESLDFGILDGSRNRPALSQVNSDEGWLRDRVDVLVYMDHALLWQLLSYNRSCTALSETSGIFPLFGPFLTQGSPLAGVLNPLSRGTPARCRRGF